MPGYTRRFHIVLLLLFSVSCDRAAAPEVVGRDSSGIRIVDATASDLPLPWTLAEMRRIGGADSGAASFTEASAWSVATDTAGHIFVLDRQNSQVAVFDTGGRVVRTMGRKGGGPGEFQFPGTLTVTPDGSVHVFDFGKHALVRFAPDGSVAPQLSLQPYGFPQGQLEMTGDTLIMVVPSGGGENDQYRVQNLKLISPRDSLVIARDSAPTPGMVMFSCVGLNIPPPFASDLAWGSEGNRIAVTRRVPYVIDVYQGGRMVLSLRRSMERIAATTDHVRRLYPEGMTVQFGGGGKCTVEAEDIIEKLGTGGDVPFIRAITLGVDGTIWVERYTFKDEPPKLDVFGSTGRYLGTLTGYSMPMGFIGDDIVLFPIEDEDTGARLVGVYRVRRDS